MRKSLFLLSLCGLLSFHAGAAIWRVNGNTGVSAGFTDLPAAVTAANNGDTILVEPLNSSSGYSSVNLTKRLVILGNGYFNDATVSGGMHTMNTGLQANMKSSVVGGINLYPGSDHSVIMGLYLNSLSIFETDITVKRCYLAGGVTLNNYNPNTGVYGNRDSINISQNIIVQGIGIYYFSTTGGLGITDVNIQNNIFSSNYYGVTLPSGVSGYFQNNVFDVPYGSISMWGFQVSNNIITSGAFTANNCVYFNNISTGTQFGNQNNNQQNISTTSLFTNLTGSGLTETRFTLNPSGPGIGAGFNSVDVGIFGGGDPYKLSGIPPIPTIYSLTAPTTTTSTTLPVTISTRSNN